MQADTSDSNIDSPHTDAAFSTGAVSDKNRAAPASPLAHPTADVAAEHDIARQSSVTSDTQATEQDKSAEKASFISADEVISEEVAVGQASLMSDGSFVNVSANQEEDSSVGLAEVLATDAAAEAEPAVDEDLSESVGDIQAASLELSAETKEVLGLLDSATQEMQASVQTDEEHAANTDADISAYDDQVWTGYHQVWVLLRCSCCVHVVSIGSRFSDTNSVCHALSPHSINTVLIDLTLYDSI